eukprot:Colp12_sorted_trinity150504_noHs@584
MSQLQKDLDRLNELLGKLQPAGNEKLLKLLKSPFLTNVRQVYECFLESAPEAERADPLVVCEQTALATVKAYAAGYCQTRTIVLNKGNTGLGFNIVGGADQGGPIFVSRIMQGGPASASSLRIGDMIVEVQESSLIGATHEDAVGKLKACEGTVRLLVRFNPEGYGEMKRKFQSA